MKKKNAFKLILCLLLLTVVCTISILAAGFRDVRDDAWYEESVRFVSEKGIMNGVGDDSFDPDGSITRGMLVTILYRMEGEPDVSGSSAFRDVKKGAYYEKAIVWASENGIVNGYNETRFGPNDSITREQLAALLYRYCGFCHGDVSAEGDLNRYRDAGEISDYAKTAMLWANQKGLVTGMTENTLVPKGTANRAQAAAIIMRYSQMMAENELPPQEEENDDPKPPEQEIQEPQEEEPEEDDPKEDDPEPMEPVSSQPTLSVEQVSAKAGEQISVAVNIQNNPGILGMTLTVSYDEQSLTLLRAESGSAVSGVLTFVPTKDLKSGGCYVWYGTELSPEEIRDGDVLTLTFAVSENAVGKLPVVLSCADGDIVDAELQTVGMLMQNGYIEVK